MTQPNEPAQIVSSDDVQELARAIDEAFISEDGQNVLDSLNDIAKALRLLGNADASTPMGAIEAHGKAVIEASENIASGLHDIASAIRETGE